MRLYQVRILLTFLMLCFLRLQLHAAEVSYADDYYTKFRNLTSLDGLSHNRILDIKQDQHGFIWIATAHGLNRYDGYAFKHFMHQTNDSTSLPGNYITSIDYTPDGTMWVGTQNGLAYYREASEDFVRFPEQTQHTSGISDAWVRCLMADSLRNVLWVETLDGVLNRINLSNYGIQYFKHAKVMAPTYDYHELYRDRAGALIIGGRDFGPLLFDEEKEVFESLPVDGFDPTKKRDHDLACAYQDQDSLCWMSATDGFYQYYKASNTFKKWLGTSTFDIVDDDGSYLWLATGSGLMHFNKERHQFTRFVHCSNDPNSLVNNHVNVLFKDKNENVWIGTAKGISILYQKKNLIRHYRQIPGNEATMPNDYVRTFLDLGDGMVWIGTHGGGVIEWNRETDTFKTLSGTEGQRISTMYRDSNGDIWIGMWSGKGFLKYDKQGKITHYAFDPNSLKRDWYNAIFEDHNRRLMLGIWGAWGVQFFNREKGVFEDYNLRLPEAQTRTYLDKLALQDNYIWTHWRGTSMYRYNIRDEKMEGWSHLDTSTFVLPEWRGKHCYHYDENMTFKKLNQMIEGERGDLIYCCTDKGLFVQDETGFHQLFKQKISEAFAIDRLDAERYILSTKQGVFIFDTATEGLQKIEKLEDEHILKLFCVSENVLLLLSEDKVKVFDLKLNSFLGKELSQVDLDVLNTTHDVLSSEKKLICTSHGLLVCDNDMRDYSLYNMANAFEKGMMSEHINAAVELGPYYYLATEKGLLKFDIHQEQFELIEPTLKNPIKDVRIKENTIWMATQQGLAYYIPESGAYTLISNMTEHRLSSHLTSFISQDSLGSLWVGTTNNGVNILDSADYTIHQFLPDETNPNAFWGQDASDMAVGNDGQVYISSNAGINIYHPEDSRFTHIGLNEGLPSEAILGMAFDSKGNLWAVCDKGLVVLNLKNHAIRLFDETWGFLPYQFASDLTAIGDEMLLPTDHGFFVFKPEELLSCQYKCTPGFTGLKVFANEKETDMISSRKVTLNYNENFFTFSFSDFCFDEMASHYFYKLDGIDPDWVATHQNEAAYTNIKYGVYQFLLTTAENMKMGMAPEVLQVKIIPPLWRRTWFMFLEFLVVFVMAYYLYRQRIKRYEQREQHLLTEQKLLRSQMNPHFVFNALIAIQSFIFQNEPKEAGRYLSKFAKLMRLFLQNTRQDFILLEQELETLNHYLELQRLRFANAFDYTISCADNVRADELKLPPMMAQPFIENAIEHGFKGIDYKGHIDVTYRLVTGALEIRILDNGIGIKQTKKQQGHKSLATTITRERLACLSSGKQLYSLQISNLKSEKTNKTGTEVLLNVPFKNEFNID